ncbi:MAG: response regulator [Cellulophaga sp.]|nr:response regulator [Cellulophaga sp.]
MKNTPYTIYLADDDEDDRQFFEDVIEDLSDEIALRIFDTGIDLLQYLRNSSVKMPDLIFLDLNMPIMDGEECLSEIRALKSSEELPVIIYSTAIDFYKAQRFRDAGANLYLKKPDKFEALKLAVANCIEHFKISGTKPGEKNNFIVQL